MRTTWDELVDLERAILGWDGLFTAAETAQRLGVTEGTLDQLVADGLLDTHHKVATSETRYSPVSVGVLAGKLRQLHAAVIVQQRERAQRDREEGRTDG